MAEVSVIIPSYNSAEFVTHAVDSVLAQSFRDFEVVVVDDGSTDDTAQRLGRYGDSIQYIRQENAGVSAARNRGIRGSRARWVAFLDADDTWYPEKLEKQMAALRGQPQFRACYSAFSLVSSELTFLRTVRSARRGSSLADLLTLGCVIGSICTVICDRELTAVQDGFDPALSQCADWDMWIRIAAETEFLYVDEPLVTYRQHGSNMSRNLALLESDSIKVLDKGFASSAGARAAGSRRRTAMARNWMVLAGGYFQAGEWLNFLRCMLRSLALDPLQSAYLIKYPMRVASRLVNRSR